MVTVELALASLLVAAVIAGCVAMAGAVFRFGACQLTANEVARQHARGDRAAVAVATADAPAGASVSVRSEGGVTVVEVRLDAFVGPATVPLVATARVVDEGQ